MFGQLLKELANMMSKNELKANHNNLEKEQRKLLVGKYDVKERIESKSQLSNELYAVASGWQI